MGRTCGRTCGIIWQVTKSFKLQVAFCNSWQKIQLGKPPNKISLRKKGIWKSKRMRCHPNCLLWVATQASAGRLCEDNNVASKCYKWIHPDPLHTRNRLGWFVVLGFPRRLQLGAPRRLLLELFVLIMFSSTYPGKEYQSSRILDNSPKPSWPNGYVAENLFWRELNWIDVCQDRRQTGFYL